MEKPPELDVAFGCQRFSRYQGVSICTYITFKAGTTLGMFHEKLLFSVFLYSEESYSSKCERSNAGRLRNSPLSAFPFKAE